MSIAPRIRIALIMTAVAVVGVVACSGSDASLVDVGGPLPIGTWGGDSAGMVVTDSTTHLHIGCTYGDFSGRVALGPQGQLDVVGSYLLRAYPIAIGPTLPARFTGKLDGSVLTVTVTVIDTIQQETVVRGPVTVKLGDAPRLGPCPICRQPAASR